MNEVLTKVLDIISLASGIDKEQLNDSTPIGASGVNSITFIEIIVKIEQELGIEIDGEDSDITNYNTIGDLLKIVEKKL